MGLIGGLRSSIPAEAVEYADQAAPMAVDSSPLDGKQNRSRTSGSSLMTLFAFTSMKTPPPRATWVIPDARKNEVSVGHAEASLPFEPFESREFKKATEDLIGVPGSYL